MSCGATRNSGALAGPGRRAGRSFAFLDLLLVLIIMGFLASVFGPRLYHNFTGEARRAAARGALAEGYARLKLATVLYILENDGNQPKALADLSPEYMNATHDLGDYTAVYVQGEGEIIVKIYPGDATSGEPLASRGYPWP